MTTIARTQALCLALLLFLPQTGTRSQVTTKVASIEPQEATANVPLTLSIRLQQGETVERLYLVYRPFGESQFTRTDVDLVGNTGQTTLPPRVMLPPFLEYYVVLQNRNGVLETYPLSENADPFSTPPGNLLHLTVRAEGIEGPGVVFLSPEPSATLSPGDVLLSVSLLRVDSSIVRRATQIFLDGADVTAGAVFSDDIIVYAPENLGIMLSSGAHRVGVRLYNKEGNLAGVATMSFTVTSGFVETAMAPAPSGFTANASVQVESRHESVQGLGTWYNRAGYQASGRTGILKLTSNVFVTSDEKSYRQPQNRFFIGAEIPWIRAGFGDSYPTFPSLILSGKRVRGLTSSLTLGTFNVDLALGKTDRAVEGSLVSSFPTDSLTVQQQRDPTAAYAPVDPLHWGKFSYGTYARDLFAVRPSFGSGRTWQLGFTWMKAKDDVGSIAYGIRPQENLVVGSDFLARFDSGRIEATGQGAFSAYNSDISSGTFNDAYIDSVFTKDASTVKQVRDIMSRFITVNDNLRPLSLKKLSTLAYDFGLALNYFDNALRFMYLYRGSDYNSFGQSFLRKDIRGFNLQDRLRIIDNRVFITAGYERLQDNTSETKAATTTFSSVTFAVSYYPRFDFPSATAGFARFVNDNGLAAARPEAIDDNTNRFFLQSMYGFQWGGQHTASLSFSTADRQDLSSRHFDVKNTMIEGGLESRFAFPLETTVNLALNLNTLPPDSAGRPEKTINFTTVTFRGRYGIVPDMLYCQAAVSPIMGDFTRTVVTVGADWFFTQGMSFLFEFGYFTNERAPDENFVSLRYRYDI
jgi:hypothetical protein